MRALVWSDVRWVQARRPTIERSTMASPMQNRRPAINEPRANQTIEMPRINWLLAHCLKERVEVSHQ